MAVDHRHTPLDPSASAAKRTAGLFVAAEGIDRSGKTTLVRGLRDHFTTAGLRVAGYKEPTSAPIGVLLRQLSAAGPVPPMALALISAADRHHQQPTLDALLATHHLVIADRYYLSGLAYHLADGIDLGFYASCAAGIRLPQVYLYLDVPPAVAARRTDRPPDSRWEEPDLTSRLPGAYARSLALIAATPNCTVVPLDARQPATAVLTAAIAVIAGRLTTTSTRSAA